MLKKLLGTILCILVMVLGVICYMEFKSPASGERIDDYLLSAGNGTYCSGTKTGSVELNIEIKGFQFPVNQNSVFFCQIGKEFQLIRIVHTE